MKYITNNDQELLFESYSSINVKQLMLESSVESFVKNAPNVSTLAEAYAILDIYNEFFGGMANVAKGAVQGIQKGAQAVGQGIQKGAQAAGQALKGAGQAVAAGASQVGSNVAGMYQTGNTAAEANKVMTQAAAAAQQIIDLINQAKELSPETFTGSRNRALAQNPSNLKLIDIINYIEQTKGTTQQAATDARNKGFFGGVGGAAKSAYQGATAGAPATP